MGAPLPARSSLAAATPAAVAATGLAVRYGRDDVWSGATFTVPEGSFTAVLGPNGSGKSTLLRLVLGLLRPSAGRLEVLGGEPRRGSPAIGYVPQRGGFDPELSLRGREYVAMGVDGQRWGPRLLGRGAREAADAAIAAVGAEALADRPMGRLSGGEQQRLALAHALAGGPRLLALDEPLSSLDVRNQAAIVRLVAGIAAERRLTVLLIAHDVNPLMAHLDQVVYIANGRVEAGDPAHVISSETLSRIYDAPVEVLRDARGRVFVAGLDEEVSHPHAG